MIDPLAPPTVNELLWLAPHLYWFWALTAFFFGLFFGSFYNVCIYRIPAGLSVSHPKRSFCFRCGTQIPWHQNLPVISYFLLKGRCGQCGAKYSARYAGVEFLTGLLFLAVFLGTNPPGSPEFNWMTLWYIAFCSLLLIGTFTDFDHWIIPDQVTFGGAAGAAIAAVAAGLIGQWTLLSLWGPFPVVRLESGADPFASFIMLIQGPDRLDIAASDLLWWEPLLNAAIGAAFGWALLYLVGLAGRLIFGKDAMGMGDVNLFLMIGATLGVTGSLVTFVGACFLGSVLGGWPMILARLKGIFRSLTGRKAPAPRTVLQEGLEFFPLGDAPAAGDTEPLVDRMVRARQVAIGRTGYPTPVHHMPFGPAIALAAILVVIFQHPLRDKMATWIF